MFGHELLQNSKKPLAATDLRSLVASMVNESFGADWAGLWPILEALSGLSKRGLQTQLGIASSTAGRWRRGEAVPRSTHFPTITSRLEKLTGISRDVIEQARELSLVRREGGSGPRPAWARQYALWGLELSHYLARLAEEQHLNYEDAAALVGYPVERWTRWVKGETVPRKWETKRVWRILGAPLGLLWAELLAARNRGARVVQIQRWRCVRARREVALARAKGKDALWELWQSAAETIDDTMRPIVSSMTPAIGMRSRHWWMFWLACRLNNGRP